MHWFLLAVTILLEVAGTICMKLSEGFTKPLYSTLVYVFYGLCFTLFQYALKKIDVGVAYAIWAGAGTVLIALFGMVWFSEPASASRVIGIGLIVAGVVLLNLGGGVH